MDIDSEVGEGFNDFDVEVDAAGHGTEKQIIITPAVMGNIE